MTDRDPDIRTSTVPGPVDGAGHLGWLLLLALSCPMVASAGEGADAARARAEQQTRAAESWLTLEGDQRRAREAAGAVSGPQSRAIQAREQQERLELRGTLDTQRRALQAQDHFDRLPSPSSGTAAQGIGRRGLIQQQGQDLEALRLRQYMRRRIESVGGGR